jgi:hypothetical protein
MAETTFCVSTRLAPRGRAVIGKTRLRRSPRADRGEARQDPSRDADRRGGIGVILIAAPLRCVGLRGQTGWRFGTPPLRL